MIDFFKAHSEIITALTAVGALLVSVISFWLSYRTSRRQKHADNPHFALKRGQGPHRIILSNCGTTAALDVSVRTKKGGFVKWGNQHNKALRRGDGGGGFVGGEEPWTTNCDGETRNLEPGNPKALVVAEDVPEDEVLIVSGRNYMGKAVKVEKPLRKIYWE